MKRYVALLLCVATVCVNVVAQPTKQQAIEEMQPGWTKVHKFKGAKESVKMDSRIFSIAQLSIADSLANWMQASYLPKAGIGEIRTTHFPKADPYSPYNVAWPQGYGAVAYTWMVNYNAKGELEKIPRSEVGWSVEANAVPGWPIRDLSTGTRYFFTMPSFRNENTRKMQDLSAVESLKPYITFWIKDVESGGGGEYVLLCKDNKSPFIKLTKGEYLQQMAEALPRAYEEEKRKIREQNKGNQRSIDLFMKSLDDNHARRLVILKNTREKHKNRLSEVAETPEAQPNARIENMTDIFDRDGDTNYTKYPVYTIDPAMFELCKKDKPQWIISAWTWTPNSVLEKHMHESIIYNFNYDYVYNFFFAPEKVKGQPYRPKRSPVLKQAVVATAKSEGASRAALDNTVHFFEDFSTTAVGTKPIGWHSNLNSAGVSALVATLPDVESNWAALIGNTIIPTGLKKPLPKNFTLTYDMMVPENFTWGAGGLILWLSKEKAAGVRESFIRLKIRPGSGGANGEVEMETKFPSAYANGSKWYVADGFSNNKKLNRINVSIKKSGETLQLMVDKKMIAEYVKGVPDDMLFNALSFEMGRSDADSEKYFVSNIKISKD